MDNSKLLRAWHILVNDLSSSAAEKLVEIANDGCLMDVDAAKEELAFAENCNWVNEILEHIADGEMDFSNLKKYVEFIKRDQGNEKDFKKTLEEIFAECDEDFTECIQPITKVVFG